MKSKTYFFQKQHKKTKIDRILLILNSEISCFSQRSKSNARKTPAGEPIKRFILCSRLCNNFEICKYMKINGVKILYRTNFSIAIFWE